ncbi:MAG: TolC family protein [Candidatus Zixiibacteriota bacterium]
MLRNMLILTLVLCLSVTPQIIAQDSLSLQDCIDLAFENNYTIKNSQLELKAAQRARQSALTNYFPSISAGRLQWNAETALLALELSDASMGLLKKGSIDYIGAVQPLFTGGRIVNGNRLARLGVDVSTIKENIARNDVVLKTEAFYWQIISLQEKALTIRAYEEMLDSLLKQVEDAYASGIVMQNDVLRVRLKRSEVLLDKSRLDNGFEQARMALCQFLGLPLNSRIVLVDSLKVEASPQALKVHHSQALPARSEYKLLELSVKAEKLQTNLVRGEYLPQAAVGINYQRLKFDENDSRSFSMIYGTVSIPISGWWGGSHELNKRKQEERIAENNMRDSFELLLLQMEKSWQDLNDAYTQYQLSEQARVQAVENLKVNQDSYDNGLTPVSDLLDARAMLQQSQDQVAEAKTHFLTERSRYLQVTGRLKH